MRGWFRFAKWFVIVALLVAANIFFYGSGYDNGQLNGAHSGITIALNDAAKRGFGEWVVVGTRSDGLPDTKFHWQEATNPECPEQPTFKFLPPNDRSILKRPALDGDST